ncbi:sensor histidine kinase [Arthrobacter alpinus]|nr:sensor histidine kinase [Arthrobacter alpinus]
MLENAVKFTGPGDTIAMTADAEGGELVLVVRDTGAGIPAADLDTIFDTFRTGATAGERAGSGLGLAIVKAVAEARGGTVSVASSLGRGTTHPPIPAADRAADPTRIPFRFGGPWSTQRTCRGRQLTCPPRRVQLPGFRPR